MHSEANLPDGRGEEIERGISAAPAPYQSGGRPDLAKPVEPVKVETPIVLLTYQAPEVVTLTTLDPAQLYKNYINPRHPEAFESGEALISMVRDFFDKLKIPVNMQVPIFSVHRFGDKGVFVMKGLQFSQEMRDAFARLIPDVQVCKPINNKILEEVHVDLDFFEGVVLGEAMATRREVKDRVMAEVAEA
jgi:hypothetical protein